MYGNTKASLSFMRLAPNANRQLGFQNKKMENKLKTNSVETFYGFWKLLGVTATFLIGIILSWWGVNIFLNDWVAIRTAAGPMGSIVLAPLVMGIALVWLSFAEFLRIIKDKE